MIDAAPAPELRAYQREAIDAVLAARRAGLRRLLVCLPTGAGKTVIFARLAQLARRGVLVLAHREELLEQARDKIARALGDPSLVDVEQGTRRARAEAKVVVASLRSLRDDRLDALVAGRDLGLVVYDECHHAPAEDNQRVLRRLGCFDDAWTGTLLGFTATTSRGDGRGLDEVFERIVYAKTLPDLVDAGFLAPLRGYRVATTTDLARLAPRAEDRLDLDPEQLAEAVDVEERNALVARSIQELARDRRTIAFCVTVGHAKNLARSLNALGVPAGVVHGAMAPDVRRDELRAFREGRAQVLTNVAVLTEGFDDPGVSCVAMARPTRSEGLYAQCVGRGTRLAPGKRDCLVLDFVDLSSLDLCTLPSLFGAPRDVDLRGEDAREARRVWDRVVFDRPGFELEAGAVTLEEIQERAARFDPLGLPTDAEVRAISGNAWFSLGRHGVGLHFERRPGVVGEALVLARPGRGKRWEVLLDGRAKDRRSTLEEAVEAVDFELERLGPRVAASGRPHAAWRREGRADALRSAAWDRVARAASGRPDPEPRLRGRSRS